MIDAKTPSNHLAMIRMERNLLANMIGFPQEAQIVQAFMDMGSMDVFFVMESPDLPEVKDGTRPPMANPTITTTFDWGLEPKDAKTQ